MVKKLEQLYAEDGFSLSPTGKLPERFARGLTTFLDSRYQNFKYQILDSRWFYKPRYTFDDTAIVIQGPIEYTNNYTVETFKLYRSIYQNVPIVVSTWKGEATDAFRKECAQNSVVLLENEPPKERGFLNVNMQIESSHQGIEWVKRNTSAKFVLKTRTDQRANRIDFLTNLKILLENFPPKGDKLRERIILFNTIWKMGFFFSDQFVFGHLIDMSRIYSIPLCQDPGEMTYSQKNFNRLVKIQLMLSNDHCALDHNLVNKQNRKLFNFNKMLRRLYNPEIYIMRTFYEKYVAPVDETKLLEISWKFAVDYLIIIDRETILIDFPKYDWERYRLMSLKSQSDFFRWLDMYRNFKIDWV